MVWSRKMWQEDVGGWMDGKKVKGGLKTAGGWVGGEEEMEN